jgi:hypothetical protein
MLGQVLAQEVFEEPLHDPSLSEWQAAAKTVLKTGTACAGLTPRE